MLIEFFFFFEVYLIYNVSSVQQSYSVTVQQSDLDIHMYIFQIIFHYKLLQDIEYSSLFYTVGLCCLFIFKWPASWETYMQVRKQQLELDMEQQTGFK